VLLLSNLFQLYAVSSSPVDVPQVKYGTFVEKEGGNSEWTWSDVSNPIYKCSDKVIMDYLYRLFLHIKTISCMLKVHHWNFLQVRSLLSSLTFSIMKISVKDASENPTKGIWFTLGLLARLNAQIYSNATLIS